MAHQWPPVEEGTPPPAYTHTSPAGQSHWASRPECRKCLPTPLQGNFSQPNPPGSLNLGGLHPLHQRRPRKEGSAQANRRTLKCHQAAAASRLERGGKKQGSSEAQGRHSSTPFVALGSRCVVCITCSDQVSGRGVFGFPSQSGGGGTSGPLCRNHPARSRDAMSTAAGRDLPAGLAVLSPAAGMEATRRRLRLHVVTWNVGTASPPPEVTSLLQLNSQDQAVDLYVIGLQEVNSKIVNFLSDMAFDDPWSLFFMTTLSPLGYVKVSSIRMQGLLLLVFAKQAHLPFIRDIRSQFTRTGLYGYWGNKGGVAVRLSLYGHAVCFLNCHLPAHMEYAEQRLDDFEHILEMQQFEGENIPGILDHDVLFWFGDLNFRIEDYGLHFIRESINKSRFSLLWEKDQLNMAKKKEAFLQEFSEGPLKFKPTYKFDLYSNEYDTRGKKTFFWFNGKKRKPAWTDRILWRVKHLVHPSSEAAEEPGEPPISASLQSYTSHMSYGVSDHKPVTGTFELQMKRLVSTPLVELHPVGDWSAERDATVSYTTTPDFASSAWDWIALYKATFQHPNDYVMYAWVQDNEISSREDAKQVYLGAEELPVTGGEFLLGYYSNALRSIVGLSQPFQVQPHRTSKEKDPFWDGIGEAEEPGHEKPPPGDF